MRRMHAKNPAPVSGKKLTPVFMVHTRDALHPCLQVSSIMSIQACELHGQSSLCEESLFHNIISLPEIYNPATVKWVPYTR